MFVVKNAWKSVTRNKGRNMLIIVIVTIIAAAATIGLSALADKQFSLADYQKYAKAPSAVKSTYYMETTGLAATDDFQPVTDSSGSDSSSSSGSSNMKDSSDTAGTDNGNRQDEQPDVPDGQMGDVAGSKDGAGMVNGDFSLIGFSSNEAVANASNGSFTMVKGKVFGYDASSNGAQSQRTNPPTLRLDNVSYAYAKGGKRVLKNISHDFQAGKVHAITGPSGAGKTTLLSLISGLATPTEGIVLVDGADLSERDRYRFRSHDIVVIFQSFNLLPNLTVAENIILSMDASGKSFDKSKKAIVEELLKQVHLPKEYTNERILHLSGGEQQRVAIARALSYGPSIIVADEPTGNLDLATQDDIMGIFRTLAHDGHRCVIIVTHSPEVAKTSDEVFELAPIRRRR